MAKLDLNLGNMLKEMHLYFLTIYRLLSASM